MNMFMAIVQSGVLVEMPRIPAIDFDSIFMINSR